MDSWFLNYINSVTELNRLLGLSFIWDGEEYKSVGARTPIGQAIMMVGVYHNQRDYSRRNVEIAKLSMLVKHLQTIEKHDKILLNGFKGIIRDTSKDWGTYFGVRMEINIAASLIQKEINFTKTESPDFTIDERNIFIECGSCHMSNNSSANVANKIRSAIFEKSDKPYCNPSTVLCLDITNVSASREEAESELLASKEAIQGMVRQILSETNSNYGSILLFSYFMDTANQFYSGYWRVDNGIITKDLRDFLDKYYPSGEFKTGSGGTPYAG